MNLTKLIGGLLIIAMISGCTSMDETGGPRGPKLISRGYANEYEHYAEVGLKFSSRGDLVAIISPSRWQSPIKTGGSLSWVNPNAWSEDAGRTGRILVGEAIILGGVAIAISVGSSGGGGSGDTKASGTVTPLVPGTPPPTPF